MCCLLQISQTMFGQDENSIEMQCVQNEPYAVTSTGDGKLDLPTPDDRNICDNIPAKSDVECYFDELLNFPSLNGNANTAQNLNTAVTCEENENNEQLKYLILKVTKFGVLFHIMEKMEIKKNQLNLCLIFRIYFLLTNLLCQQEC